VVNQRLVIHSSGRVTGNIRYGQIEIARGGVISGQIDVLANAANGAGDSAAESEGDMNSPAGEAQHS
jgi:cytoskeletal protein CcmA (bactofilin family)